MGIDGHMKIIVGLATAAALSLSGWNLLTVVSHESRISTTEERSQGVRDRLERMENKIDWLVQERIKDYARPGFSNPTRRESP